MANGQTTDKSLSVSRVVKAPREQVYRAWLDPGSPRMRQAAPNQAPGRPMEVEIHEFEPRVGGAYRISMIADEGPVGTHTFAGKFLELVPNERIVQSHRWVSEEGGGEQPETKVTITFKDVADGTEVTIMHEGLPGKESVENHMEGWSEALENLAAAYASG